MVTILLPEAWGWGLFYFYIILNKTVEAYYYFEQAQLFLY